VIAHRRFLAPTGVKRIAFFLVVVLAEKLVVRRAPEHVA